MWVLQLNKLRKAYLMRRRKISYEKEKRHSIRIAHGKEIEKIACSEKFKDCLSGTLKYILKTKCCRLLECPRRFLCFFLISFLFFLLGLLLAYLFFALLLFQLHLSIHQTTLVCLLLGLVFSLGLAFNFKIRLIPNNNYVKRQMVIVTNIGYYIVGISVKMFTFVTIKLYFHRKFGFCSY